ncbi:uncharacterized protein At2g34160-like isoform X1 [Cucurbita pepo subsp. pepo]|uniref:uncharacterized protein At2g34160-like isoform X1 n=1 Tax=Cucurbita pepo subsp. pepo TaxID=3664 RepID=UPI000C9D46DB|nr:uncharacterized protein At2g34160-like isoform X1 [Cucurbita pepo subsp. pepo]
MATMAVSGATAAATPTPAAAATETQKKNRIQVSNTKKPLFFYVNLAKRYIQQHNEVELSALGMAITTVVTIAEILKNNGLATEKKVLTSTVGMKDENKGRLVQKAKIEIVLGKSEKFDSLMTAATAVPEAAAATTAVVAATATVTATAAPAAAEEKKEEESKEEQ